MQRARIPLFLSLSFAVACGGDESVSQDAGSTLEPSTDAGLVDSGPSPDAGASADNGNESDEPRVGFEILQFRSANEIVVWVSADLTQAEFDAIELPPGWFKNQPREFTADSGFFARSPGAQADGEYVYEVHFGHRWLHNATVVEANVPVDAEGLLRLNRVAKFHTITFDAGRTLSVLYAPGGEAYVRVSRDAGRTSEVPTLPSDWRLESRTISEPLTIELPNPTDNIRADNEDSWQGPVPGL